MSEIAGRSVIIKISGASTATVGETTTAAGNLTYQITDAAKRVLDRTGLIRVHKKGTNGTSEAGTTTTNIKITTHGLVVGDLICNTSRANAYRLVTVRVDADNVTVASVTSQTNGDTIERYPTELATAYSLNRLNGMVTYPGTASRTIKISGSYLPMATAAYAHSMSKSMGAETMDVTAFPATHRKRLPGLKFASGTLNQFDVTDTAFSSALIAGLPIVIEDVANSGAEPNRFWALLEKDEVTAALSGPQDESISWTATDAWLRLGV